MLQRLLNQFKPDENIPFPKIDIQDEYTNPNMGFDPDHCLSKDTFDRNNNRLKIPFYRKNDQGDQFYQVVSTFDPEKGEYCFKRTQRYIHINNGVFGRPGNWAKLLEDLKDWPVTTNETLQVLQRDGTLKNIEDKSRFRGYLVIAFDYRGFFRPESDSMNPFNITVPYLAKDSYHCVEHILDEVRLIIDDKGYPCLIEKDESIEQGFRHRIYDENYNLTDNEFQKVKILTNSDEVWHLKVNNETKRLSLISETSKDEVLLSVDPQNGELTHTSEINFKNLSNFKQIVTDGFLPRYNLNDPENPQTLLNFSQQRAVPYHKVHIFSWSTGVQVSYQMLLEHPEIFGDSLLLNGTWGRVMTALFSPFFRIPGQATFFSTWVSLGLNNRNFAEFMLWFFDTRIPAQNFFWGKVLNTLAFFSEEMAAGISYLFQDLISRRHKKEWNAATNSWEEVYLENGEPFMEPYNFVSFAYIGMALQSHNIYHYLYLIDKKCFLVSGGLDFIVPAYQSFEAAEKLPQASHLHSFFASHALMWEEYERLRPLIIDFLNNRMLDEVTVSGFLYQKPMETIKKAASKIASIFSPNTPI